MRVSAIYVAIACLIAACAPAQTSAVPGGSHGSLAIVVQLNKNLNVKKLKTQDRITAKVLQDVVSGGRIWIPRDSKLIGHVEEAQAVSGSGSVARLALIFDWIDLKPAGTMSVHGVIRAVAPPIVDPALEAAMASSSGLYGGTQSGHPVNTGAPSGQTNVPTPVVRQSMTEQRRALEERGKALQAAEEDTQSEQLGPHGALSARNRGVFGFPGLALKAETVPVLISAGHNIELKSGTQLVLRLEMEGSATPPNH